jgi:hypothetical protein
MMTGTVRADGKITMKGLDKNAEAIHIQVVQ